MLVPGKSSVVAVTSTFMRFALRRPGSGRENVYEKAEHSAVIVTHPEPANSHPIVNFSSGGVSLFIREEQQIVEIF